jgi:hypothetical protein
MNSMKSLVMVAISSAVLFACGPINPGISDIDRSQPSVSVTGITNALQKTIDWEAGRKKATKQCLEFGYNKAEALDFGTRRCTKTGQFGCEREEITRKYICRK